MPIHPVGVDPEVRGTIEHRFGRVDERLVQIQDEQLVESWPRAPHMGHWLTVPGAIGECSPRCYRKAYQDRDRRSVVPGSNRTSQDTR